MASMGSSTDKPAGSAPANILLVDDRPSKLLTCEIALGELGENLIKASSVEDALGVLLKTDVALLLTDISMPGADGFELARLTREHPRFREIPIIFISSYAQSDLDRLRGYASGAVDYLTAPVAPDVLRAKVKVFIDMFRKQRELQALRSELEARVESRTARLETLTKHLSESEDRYRSLFDNANDIVATFDRDFRITAINPAVERILGYAPAELVGTLLTRYVPKDDLATLVAMLRRKLAGEPSTHYEVRVFEKGRERQLALEVNSRLMFSKDGKPVGIHAIARDITERKEAEARQLVLIRELQHRAKNLLAVVQSIMTNTLARSRDVESASIAILGRLQALARAQDFVVSGNSGGVPLRDLVEAELSGFAERANVDGVPIVVGGVFAQQFALVVHELATNAAKYGALSGPSGKVDVSWSINREPEDHVVAFSWVERDGPAVTMPTQEGFGTRLISTTLNGDSRLSFAENGLQFRLEIPMSEVMRTSKIN